MMIFMLQLPLLFWSNSLYPLTTLPTWMRVGAMLNPTTYVVTGLRTMTMAPAAGADAITAWVCFVVVAAFAAVGMGLALKAFTSAIQ
jgi:ABC-2 type transport system permease protein